MSKPEMLSRGVVASWLDDDGIAKDRTLATIEALHDALSLVERAREPHKGRCTHYTRGECDCGRFEKVAVADAAVADLKTKGWVTNG